MPARRDNSIGMAMAAAGLSESCSIWMKKPSSSSVGDARCGGHGGVLLVLGQAAAWAATVKSGMSEGASANAAIRRAELARANWSITLNALVR